LEIRYIVVYLKHQTIKYLMKSWTISTTTNGVLTIAGYNFPEAIKSLPSNIGNIISIQSVK